MRLKRLLIWLAFVGIGASQVQDLGDGACVDQRGELYDAFFINSAEAMKHEGDCWRALQDVLHIDGVVGAQYSATETRRCQILTEDGVDPREEGTTMFWKHQTCKASKWDCFASWTNRFGRGRVAQSTRRHGALRCCKVLQPNLRSIQTAGFQVRDALQLDPMANAQGYVASPFDLTREIVVRMCQKNVHCMGITCRGPDFHWCSLRFQQRTRAVNASQPADALRSYIKWLRPRSGGLDFNYHFILVLLHHKG
eukprot:1848510-Amphidinium_carterae.1